MTKQSRVDKGLYWDRAWSLVEGCSPASEGCRNCWAAASAHMRLNHPNDKIRAANSGVTDKNGCFNGHVRFRNDLLELPTTVHAPTVWSIWTDLFHEPLVSSDPGYRVFADIGGAFDVMRYCHQHTFLILTKRPEVALEKMEGIPCWFGNIWLGTTVESQDQLGRLGILSQIPAAHRFLSIEPMLGPIDLTRVHYLGLGSSAEKNLLTGEVWIPGNCGESSRTIQGKKIEGVIVGGETGPNARPMHPDWVRSIRDQCAGARVPFFFKGWGEWLPLYEAEKDIKILRNRGRQEERWINFDGGHEFNGNSVVRIKRIGRIKSGRLLDGVEHNERPW